VGHSNRFGPSMDTFAVLHVARQFRTMVTHDYAARPGEPTQFATAAGSPIQGTPAGRSEHQRPSLNSTPKAAI